MEKTQWVRKLTSRKFWMAVAEFVTALLIYLKKDATQAESLGALIMLAVAPAAYMFAEGWADSGGKPIDTDNGNVLQWRQYTAREEQSVDTLQCIAARQSYRGKYSPEPVPREDLKKILEAGLAAPSGCNKQTASLIAVDDPAVLERLRAVIDPPVGETAPALICVLTQRLIAYRDRCFAAQDYAAAIENMLLAIKALGYESCWYEGHITDADRIGDKMAAILGVPEGYELVCVLPVGVAAEALPPIKKKKPFAERAWFNGFGR